MHKPHAVVDWLFFCYASAYVSLSLLLVSSVKLVTVKESSIKPKSTKNAAKFSTFILFILVFKPFKCLQNFPRLSRETSRRTRITFRVRVRLRVRFRIRVTIRVTIRVRIRIRVRAWIRIRVRVYEVPDHLGGARLSADSKFATAPSAVPGVSPGRGY